LTDAGQEIQYYLLQRKLSASPLTYDGRKQYQDDTPEAPDIVPVTMFGNVLPILERQPNHDGQVGFADQKVSNPYYVL
jgi:hypothetical protein